MFSDNLEKLVNNGFKSDIKTLYGDQAKVRVNNVIYINSKKAYLVDLTVHTNEIDKSITHFPDSLEYIVDMAWDIFNIATKPIVMSTITYLEE